MFQVGICWDSRADSCKVWQADSSQGLYEGTVAGHVQVQPGTLLLLKNPGQCMGTEQVDQAQSFVLLCPHRCPLSGPVFAGEVGKQQFGTRAANGPLHLGVHCKSLFSLTLSHIHVFLESSYCDSHYGGHTVDFWDIGLHCGSKRLALPMRVQQYYQFHL